MNAVLQLQQLVPNASKGEIDVFLMSTASGICPTTAVTGENHQFEIE